MTSPLVGIIMGSKTALAPLEGATEVLREFGIAHEVRILSAHRTPEKLLEWAQTAEQRGLQVIIAAAGLAAALPGGDALRSIVQMPKGVPVGTLAIGEAGAANAALLAVAILAAVRPELRA